MTADEILAPQNGDLPHATPSQLTAPFWQGCARGELRFQRCNGCGAANFPPQEHCRHCLSFDQEWEASPGHGRLYSWTIVHRPVTPAFRSPYAPAIVTLDEGYQMITNVIGVTPGALELDLELQVAFHHVDGKGFWLPYFAAAK